MPYLTVESKIECRITGFCDIPANVLEAIVASKVLEPLGLTREHFGITKRRWRWSNSSSSSSDEEMFKEALGIECDSDGDKEKIIDYERKDYEVEEEGPGWYEDVPFYGWHLRYEALQLVGEKLVSCDRKILCVSLFSIKKLNYRTIAGCQIVTPCEGGECCPWAEVTLSRLDVEAMNVKLLPGDVSFDGLSLIGAIGEGPSSREPP